MRIYQGQEVDVRKIRPTDPGFDPSAKQVIVKLDGTEMAVPAEQVATALNDPAARTAAAERPAYRRNARSSAQPRRRKSASGHK